MSKVPKKSIGLVNACTLYNPKNWSTLNGEQFCGVEKREEPSKVIYSNDLFDRMTADKMCKAKVISLLISTTLNFDFTLTRTSHKRKAATTKKQASNVKVSSRICIQKFGILA